MSADGQGELARGGRGAHGGAPFTIVIVDDEAIVREGIRDRIAWRDLGFELRGEFADGRAALDAIRRDPPDAILTDIRMPFVDGIELTRAVAAELPGTRVLLLTGHDEFEYAQSAVRLQVWDFLLKPISARELSDVLQRLGSDLAAERTRATAAAELRRRWESSLPILVERAWGEALEGNGPVADALARLADLGVAPPRGRVRVVLVSVDAAPLDAPAPATPPDEVTLALGELLLETIPPRIDASVAALGGDRFAVIIFGADGTLRDLLEQVRRAAFDRTGRSVTIAVGRPYGSLAELRRSVADATAALARRFITGGNRIVEPPVAAATAPDRSAEHREKRAELTAALRGADRAGALAAVASIVDLCRAAGGTARCVRELQRTVARILDVADDLGVGDALDSRASPSGRADDPFAAITAQPDLDAVGRMLATSVSAIVTRMEQQMRSAGEVKVRAAITLVSERFADPDLSLVDVCNELAISTSHFSQSFKAVTGRTFIEYLTQVRVDAAKEMLRAGIARTGEVGEAVGYRDPHYFSRTFRKVCGESPTEYRVRVAGGEA